MRHTKPIVRPIGRSLSIPEQDQLIKMYNELAAAVDSMLDTLDASNKLMAKSMDAMRVKS